MVALRLFESSGHGHFHSLFFYSDFLTFMNNGLAAKANDSTRTGESVIGAKADPLCSTVGDTVGCRQHKDTGDKRSSTAKIII